MGLIYMTVFSRSLQRRLALMRKPPLAIVRRTYELGDDDWDIIPSLEQQGHFPVKQIIFLREPTNFERRMLKKRLIPDKENDEGSILLMDDILDKAWKYDDLCK